MKLTPIKANMTEVELTPGLTVLFSYQTPVAYHNYLGYFVTEKKWSKTTTRHINQWLQSMPENEDYGLVPQETIDNICK
jgi:hypothetical protein